MIPSPTQVAWVESPLQFVSAAEYAAATGRRVAVAFRLGTQMTEAARELLDRRAPFSTCAPYFGIPWRELARAQHWVIGDAFSGQFQLAASVLRPKMVTLLDDGEMSLQVATALSGDGAFSRPGLRRARPRRLIEETARELLVRRALVGRLEFASVFGVERREFAALADTGVRLQRNDFAWTRATARPAPLPPGTVVLGTARVADGLLDELAHRRWIGSIAERVPVVYLPHRRETAEHLATLAAIAGVTVFESGLPVELVLAGMHDLDIVTSGSSASATLAHVLRESGSQIRSLAVPISDVVR